MMELSLIIVWNAVVAKDFENPRAKFRTLPGTLLPVTLSLHDAVDWRDDVFFPPESDTLSTVASF